MALKTAYGDAGYDVWAITHIDERAHNDAPTQWASFASEARTGDITFATLQRAGEDTDFFPPRHPVGRSSLIGADQAEVLAGDVKNGTIFADRFRDKLLHIHETG